MSSLFPDYSRSRLQEWIRSGAATVDGVTVPTKHKVLGGEHIALRAEAETSTDLQAQDIPIHVVFEDDAVLILDKPAGLVVHPAAGHHDGTLQNALLNHCPRAGRYSPMRDRPPDRQGHQRLADGRQNTGITQTTRRPTAVTVGAS